MSVKKNVLGITSLSCDFCSIKFHSDHIYARRTFYGVCPECFDGYIKKFNIQYSEFKEGVQDSFFGWPNHQDQWDQDQFNFEGEYGRKKGTTFKRRLKDFQIKKCVICARKNIPQTLHLCSECILPDSSHYNEFKDTKLVIYGMHIEKKFNELAPIARFDSCKECGAVSSSYIRYSTGNLFGEIQSTNVWFRLGSEEPTFEGRCNKQLFYKRKNNTIDTLRSDCDHNKKLIFEDTFLTPSKDVNWKYLPAGTFDRRAPIGIGNSKILIPPDNLTTHAINIPLNTRYFKFNSLVLTNDDSIWGSDPHTSKILINFQVFWCSKCGDISLNGSEINAISYFSINLY